MPSAATPAPANNGPSVCHAGDERWTEQTSFGCWEHDNNLEHTVALVKLADILADNMSTAGWSAVQGKACLAGNMPACNTYDGAIPLFSLLV
jgi:hypothetical protein